MLSFITSKVGIRVVLGLAIVLAVGGAWYYIRHLQGRVDSLQVENALKDETIQMLDTERKRCESDKKITFESANEYQTKLNNLASQYNALKRVRENPRCVPIIAE